MSHGTGTESAPNAFALEVLRPLPHAEAFHTVYGKLARLPLPVAEAFLTALTQRLRPLFPATARTDRSDLVLRSIPRSSSRSGSQHASLSKPRPPGTEYKELRPAL